MKKYNEVKIKRVVNGYIVTFEDKEFVYTQLPLVLACIKINLADKKEETKL